MRLIDADELKERFCKENCGQRRCIDNMDKCVWITSVEESKTAYDVKKVVKRLEEAKNIYSDLSLAIRDASEAKKYISMEQAVVVAINIVKGRLN